ncbi:hypothetical protein NQ314_011855 [Rhamnusium bicolor]|uniref:Uncharacterized protein n=1 Tax=Rhamnusium bicolor TaxID=1586634 RepID=A0AAV8XFD8_9CUCU|nr:hypothetical protein NQ314_011855 [Rhamnusium bicolor]
MNSESGHSNIVEPYYNIVDGLIQQVSNLQSRIQSIESISLSNSVDHWFDHTDNMQNTSSGFRKYSSIDDLYIPPSTHSTPSKTSWKI